MRQLRWPAAIALLATSTVLAPSMGSGVARAPSPSVETTGTAAIVAKMTLSEKIGQMMMVGFYGTTPSGAIRASIKKQHIGSIIIFERNIASKRQVATLDKTLQLLARHAGHKARLLIAVDQEGDPIRRFRDLAPYYSEPEIGRMGARAAPTAEQQTYLAGRQLKALGINTDLTPVLDVSAGPGTVMASRSYSRVPRYVAGLGARAVKGFNHAKIVSSSKHFPGHGFANGDSEITPASVPGSRATIMARDVLPYRSAIRAGAPMIMTAHLSYPGLDPSRRPATFSHRILTDLLRKDLGFKGVVVTDDLEMGAIVPRLGIGKAAVWAVEAGSDMVMVCHTPSRQGAAYRALIAAVRSGRLSQARIDQSVTRILEMKKKYGLLP